MGYENRYHGIDNYAVQIIRYKAKQLVGRVGFTESDRQDLEQEMVFDLLRRLPKFKPERAQRNTFKGGFGHFSSSTRYGKREDTPEEFKDRKRDPLPCQGPEAIRARQFSA